ELTATFFYEIKGAGVSAAFDDPAHFMDAEQHVTDELQAAQEFRELYDKHLDSLDFIAQVEPILLFNPAFQGKARADAVAMRKTYQEVAQEVDLIIKQLNRSQVLLHSYLASLPLSSTHKEVEKIARLRAQLQVEITLLQKNSDFYTKLQTNLSGKEGILQAINDAVHNKKNYTYQPKGVSARPINSDGTVAENQSAVSASIGASATKYKLEEGSAFIYDDVYDGTTADGAKFQTLGRFTQKYEQTKSSNPKCTFEILQPPQLTSKGQVSEAEMFSAQIKFYTDIAVALLVANGGTAPTAKHPIRINGYDKTQLQYIWTALMVLGEKDPRFGKDAIKVETGPFDPDSEMGYFGFKKESLYHEVFKNPAYNLQDLKTEPVIEFVKIVTDSDEKRIKASEAVSLFKNELEKNKIKGQNSLENIDDDEPAPFSP
ncbi:MAG: hypothetical protein PSV35_03285, partial [bacterium]|nr:hypothetical protein [bacterium]